MILEPTRLEFVCVRSDEFETFSGLSCDVELKVIK